MCTQTSPEASIMVLHSYSSMSKLLLAPTTLLYWMQKCSIGISRQTNVVFPREFVNALPSFKFDPTNAPQQCSGGMLTSWLYFRDRRFVSTLIVNLMLLSLCCETSRCYILGLMLVKRSISMLVHCLYQHIRGKQLKSKTGSEEVVANGNRREPLNGPAPVWSTQCGRSIA